MQTSAHTRNRGFTLIEILLVILIIGVLLGIALPAMLTARTSSANRSCRENLRAIESAKERFAIENNFPSDGTPTWTDLVPIFVKGRAPQCPMGGTYTIGRMDEDPVCSYGGEHTID